MSTGGAAGASVAASPVGDVGAGGGGNNVASRENEVTGERAMMGEEEHTFDEGLDNIRRIRAARAHLDENWEFNDFPDEPDIRPDGKMARGRSYYRRHLREWIEG